MDSVVDDDLGKRVWAFPDGELPPAGNYDVKGHESLIVLNTQSSDARISLSLYFVDREPIEGIEIYVGSRRVKCIRMDNPNDLQGTKITREEQYAIVLESSVPVVAQYGRADTRNQPLAFYTTPGYCQ